MRVASERSVMNYEVQKPEKGVHDITVTTANLYNGESNKTLTLQTKT